jgi:hypothetical protein
VTDHVIESSGIPPKIVSQQKKLDKLGTIEISFVVIVESPELTSEKKLQSLARKQITHAITFAKSLSLCFAKRTQKQTKKKEILV